MQKSQKSLLKSTLWFFKESVPKLFSPISVSCIYCHSPIRSRKGGLIGLCESCTLTISWIREVVCSVCGRYEACTDCTRRIERQYIINRSAVEYSDEMREWLARYKYRGDESLLPLLVEMLRFPFESLQLILSKSQKRFDWITYIPLSQERLAERGFNQAEQLARGLGKVYGISVGPLLKKVLHTGKQSYKTREQRLGDLQNAFMYEVPELALLKLQNPQSGTDALNILVIDDVYTTGSTLNQCALVIRQHLNAQIYGLTWAR